MKKLLLFLITVFCFVIANAQEQYEVTSKSSLNFRSSPSANSTVLGCLQSGSKVDVYETFGEWSKIKYNGRYVYVNNKYLKKCNVDNVAPSSQNIKENKVENSFFDQLLYSRNDAYAWWLIYVILGLSIVLAVIRMKQRDIKGYLSNDQHTFNLIVFILTCIVEFIYFAKMGLAMSWFCIPSEVGWICAIIAFFTYGWVVYNQVLCFLETMNDLRYNAGDFDMSIGLLSWPIAAIAALIANIAGWEGANLWIFIILGVCQLIQIGIIIAGVLPKSGFASSLLVIAIYLMGAISTMIILIEFCLLLIIVAFIGFLLIAFLGGASRSGSSSNSKPQEGYLEHTDGTGRIEGEFYNDHTFRGYDGTFYEKNPDGNWRIRER